MFKTRVFIHVRSTSYAHQELNQSKSSKVYIYKYQHKSTYITRVSYALVEPFKIISTRWKILQSLYTSWHYGTFGGYIIPNNIALYTSRHYGTFGGYIIPNNIALYTSIQYGTFGGYITPNNIALYIQRAKLKSTF